MRTTISIRYKKNVVVSQLTAIDLITYTQGSPGSLKHHMNAAYKYTEHQNYKQPGKDGNSQEEVQSFVGCEKNKYLLVFCCTGPGYQ